MMITAGSIPWLSMVSQTMQTQHAGDTILAVKMRGSLVCCEPREIFNTAKNFPRLKVVH